MTLFLKKNDIIDDGMQIVEEDRLCFLVETTSRGTKWVRTIRKKLVEEFVEYIENNPSGKAEDAKGRLSGLSEIDKYEYGYNATLFRLAKQSILNSQDPNYKLGLKTFSSPQNTSSNNQSPLQIIYFGAPGTGKSYAIDKIANKDNSVRTTFHPDSDYSTFVGCYKPIKKSNSEEITYDFVPQAFTTAYINAWKNLEEPYYLVIEEINRGNCAQVFGDIFQLLDRNENGFSSYKITPDQDLQIYLHQQFANTNIVDYEIKSGAKMQLPANLHILATMNTSDQSLFPIDSAFKRRWDWKYIPIDYTDLGHYISCGNKQYSWVDFLVKVNEQIESVTQSEDKKMGGWFVKPIDQEISEEKFVSKVVFYLWNDIFRDFAHGGSTIFKDNFDKFHKFFDFKGAVNEDVLEKFFESLKIQFVDISENDEEETNSKAHLIVKFPDGTTISESTRFESYHKALQFIGLDKAEQVAATMKYKRLDSPLISKSKSENIISNTQKYSYVEDGEYNIIKGLNTRTMRKFIQQISDEFNLNISCVVE